MPKKPHTKHVSLMTPLGKIKGFETVVMKKEIRHFLGVPFAEPPVGERRFKPPEPKKPWSDELDTTRLANTCFQVI